MSSLLPNKDDILRHLSLQFDWTEHYHPNACFEVRCLQPDQRPRWRIFDCILDGYAEAALFAVQYNLIHYNIYVTANPLKPGTDHSAKDADVIGALFQFTDNDKGNQFDDRGFKPEFIVTTGTIPTSRTHTYWTMAQPVQDMAIWAATQRGLAADHGTDSAVTNPSRIVRLAGTVSYPPLKKRDDGYVAEVTRLETLPFGYVCRDSFQQTYMAFDQPKAKPEAAEPTWEATGDGSGNVPLFVIATALKAIPVINGVGRRKEWLDLANCCCDANPNSQREFNVWQRLSDRYDPHKDPDVYRTLHPRPGCYVGLFSTAKLHDERWWVRDEDTREWWQAEARRRAREQADTENHRTQYEFDDDRPDDDEADSAQRPNMKPTKFKRHNMEDLNNFVAPEWLFNGLAFREQVGMMYAPPGKYKSFIMLSLASMLTHGMVLNGRKLRPGRVVYVAAEGFSMMKLRRLAWFKHHGMKPANDGLEIINGPVDLTNSADVAAFIEDMLDIPDRAVAIFDTISACSPGQDECSSTVMSTIVGNAKMIASVCKITVVLIHHPGKDVSRGARGHSSLKGNIDFEWEVTTFGDGMAKLEVTKQKDDACGQEYLFKAHTIDLGIYDQDGVERTSLALVPHVPFDDFPGQRLDEITATLQTIAPFIGDAPMRVSDLRKKLGTTLAQSRAVSYRLIEKALPLNEWRHVQTPEGAVELRRTGIPNAAKGHQIESRAPQTTT